MIKIPLLTEIAHYDFPNLQNDVVQKAESELLRVQVWYSSVWLQDDGCLHISSGLINLDHRLAGGHHLRKHFNIKADFTESGSRVDRIHWTIYYVMWDEWWLTVTRVVFVFVNVFQLTRNRGRPLVPLAKETASVVSDASGLWDQGTPCWKR